MTRREKIGTAVSLVALQFSAAAGWEPHSPTGDTAFIVLGAVALVFGVWLMLSGPAKTL